MLLHHDRRRQLFLATLAVVAFGLGGISSPIAAHSAETSSNKQRADGRSGRMEARFTDGSSLKLTVLDTHLRFKTDYGELRIPLSDIRRIDFATRMGDELAKEIAAAVGELGHDDYAVRERASERLAEFGAAAYPALLKAADDADLEVVQRAERLLMTIRETLPAEQYEVRSDDLVHTAKSKIAGQIDAATITVTTEAFGKQELRLELLRSLRPAGAGLAELKTALADPGTLSNYQSQMGKAFRFQVTGGFPRGAGGGFAGGAVWGTEVYTLDSTLSMAAVHAGVLKSGETGVVSVSILGPQNSFAGSTQNGITTSPWGAFPGAFKFNRDDEIP